MHTTEQTSDQMATLDSLIDGLNQDLAAEWGTIIRYTYQWSHAGGVAAMGLRDLFESEIQDELGHAMFLTDVIVDLGGVPTTAPKEFDKPKTLGDMLELDLKMELGDVENYRNHSELAAELGYAELTVRLEEMAADEAGHARELRRLLKEG